ALTGGDTRAAYAVMVPAASGTYFLRPSNLDGSEPVEFLGTDYGDVPSSRNASTGWGGDYEAQYSMGIVASVAANGTSEHAAYTAALSASAGAARRFQRTCQRKNRHAQAWSLKRRSAEAGPSCPSAQARSGFPSATPAWTPT